MRNALVTAAASLALALSFASGARAQDEKKLEVGSTAPEGFAEHLEFVQGDKVETFSKDKVYVVEFWATWCGPCKRSIPHLTELQTDLGSRGLEIIGVSDEPVDLVKKFVKEKGSAMGYTVATQKKDDTFIKEKWMKAAGQKGIPCAFVISRSGKIVHIGNPLDENFDRIIKQTLANRYDPELMSRVEPTINAARNAAKRRNFKEASSLYAKAIAENPSTLLEYSFESWRMLNEQADDTAGAKALLTSTIDGIKTDKYALIEAANYLATDANIKKRDLDAAQVVADKLKALPGTKDDPEVLAAMAAVSAGRGNFAAAAEMQYDAWMAAAPAAKPAAKRALDSYEAKAKDPKATAK
jgi:thiol-disulfide isomerase/thioredoxin